MVHSWDDSPCGSQASAGATAAMKNCAYSRILGFELADAIEPIAIENL